ncbi:protein kinase domain-containing protein [Ramlibacter humi]|uniref:Response regulator n=1 Tax=Ramlibacter humi TaxID=2530451 RepID=A0A4Z0BB61_9BURK|nr:protein kinase [Ramlibacter humi]TFY96342.1 response regulator [Ramlibacter humi]
MTTILVVEDDDAIRNNITRLLKLEGYDIVTAIDGTLGLERAREVRPDIVISDISMPQMDGFAMLDAIRADDQLAATPVMLLTALDDRASMRRGMTAGADDYLAKPFTRVELLEALQGLLKKKGRIDHSIEQAVSAREAHLRRAFTESIGGRTLTDKFGLEAPQGVVAGQAMQATVLFADIRNFTALAEKLNSTEVAELLTEYFERCCEPVLRHRGGHIQFIGDGLMAVFAESREGMSLPNARRAVSAALGVALAAHEFRTWLADRFAGRGLPPFAIGVGLHEGEVTLCRVGTADARETGAIGEPVNVAARLESASKELGWTVVASTEVIRSAGAGVQTGGVTSLQVRGQGGYVEVAEVLGLEAEQAGMVWGMATLAARAQDVRAAVQVNSEITARAVKGALQSKLSALKAHQFAPGEEPLRLRGYRLTRKIGVGGMTEVYLAEREPDGLPVVLKVLDASGKKASEHLSRFIQEYALLSRIEHPNVVRIYAQGFTDDHAYIAMEYFPGGDLRSELGAGMAQQRVLEVLAQIAQALTAIHGLGVIHRDLKPENIMRRADDTVALADFGIAKSLLSDNLALTQTGHGDVVGTPYYLSPEQASASENITPASDLYSLGVMMYEMLTGERPYRAPTLNELLSNHLRAPLPRLPQPHEKLQPILDRLMAKSPDDRFSSAHVFLAELELRQLLSTVRRPLP